MSRSAIPSWYYVLVVVRLGRRFLLVRERKHGQQWYLPAGRVEPGETLVAAAQRECLEEAALPIAVEGVLRLEHSAGVDGTRNRVYFIGRPCDDRPPKTAPDEHSLAAAWVTLDEMAQLPLRGAEVLDVLSAVELGHPIYPLSLLTGEGAAWPRSLP